MEHASAQYSSQLEVLSTRDHGTAMKLEDLADMASLTVCSVSVVDPSEFLISNAPACHTVLEAKGCLCVVAYLWQANCQHSAAPVQIRRFRISQALN